MEEMCECPICKVTLNNSNMARSTILGNKGSDYIVLDTRGKAMCQDCFDNLDRHLWKLQYSMNFDEVCCKEAVLQG